MSRAARSARAIPYGRIVILVQAALAVAFVAYLLHGDGVRVPLLSSTETVELELVDAAGLNDEDHHPVTLAGVRVGEVRDVRYADRRAVATLELDDGIRERLRDDARALVVPRSALQDQTVELQPGSSPARLADGRRITVDRTAAPVALDELLGTLDADTRSYLQILLGELEVGTKDAGTPLRRALRELGPAMDSSTRVASALDDRRTQLARLVTALDRVFGTLARRRGAIDEVLRSGEAIVDVTGRRDAELRETVRELPGALAALDGALSATSRLARPLTAALTDLEPAARRLPGALSAVRELTPSIDGLISDLEPVARDGRAPARSLSRALAALRPASTGLTPSIRRLTPVLRDIDANKDGIGLLGERFSGVFSTTDANGPILRGLGFFEAFDPAGFGEPGARGARLTRLKRDAVRALKQTCKTNAAACLVPYLVPGLPEARGLTQRPRAGRSR